MSHNPPLIVIADDDMDYLQLMQELLIEVGYQVLVTTSGPDAYRLIREKQPNVAILDVFSMNPDAPMVTLTMLRLDPTTKDIPVLICSVMADMMHQNATHLITMGCRMLIKPFYLDTMLDEIRNMIGLSHADMVTRQDGQSDRQAPSM